MSAKPVPEGYHAVTPYLIVDGAAKAIEFYCQALGAAERMRLAAPDGKVGHAELQLGDSVVMLADEFPEMGAVSPKRLGGSPVGLALYVEDVDARFERAVAAGAKVVRPVQDQFYGDRSGTIEDPFGHKWTLSTHIEDVPPEEVTRRFEAAAAQAGQ
jgi:PhnB protein